jgi:hypothetical protein
MVVTIQQHIPRLKVLICHACKHMHMHLAEKQGNA